MELEVRHLRVICAVAEAGSLTRAAAALRLTQPGLSAQLQRIETALGARLFTRSAAGVTPTDLGEVVLTRARAVLPAMDDLVRLTAVKAHASQAPHRFRVGSVTSPLIGGVLDAIRELFPDANVTSRQHASPLPLLDDLADGRLEIAVVGDSPGYEHPAPPGVVLAPVVTEPVFVVMPRNHPHAAQAAVDLAELADEDWAAPPVDGDRTREYWSSTLAGAAPTLRIVHEAEGRLLLDLVRTGHAVALCQATFPEAPGVAVRPIRGDPLWYRHMLGWHADGPFAGVEEVVVARARAAYQAVAESGEAYRMWLAARREVDLT